MRKVIYSDSSFGTSICQYLERSQTLYSKLIFRLKDEKTAPFAPRVVDVITDVSELAADIPLTNGLNGSGLKGNAVC